MDLGNAFQVVLFLLPGFVFLEAFAASIPTRRDGGDARLILQSIGATAVIWTVTAVASWSAGALVPVLGQALGKGWRPDLTGWLQTTIFGKANDFHALIPGVALNIAAVLAGVGIARGVFIRNGRLRPISVLRVTFDPRPRVWNAFFAKPRGTWFRIALHNGRTVAGQVRLYSEDPNDNLAHVVLAGCSDYDKDSGYTPRPEIREMLIARDDIDSVDILDVVVP